MPHVDNCGLFIPTGHLHDLGEVLLIILRFPELSCAAEGRVVWVTPKNTLSDRKAGIGVQFLGDNETLKQCFEALLSKAPEKSSTPGATY